MAQRKTIYTTDSIVKTDIDLLNDAIIPANIRHFVKAYLHLCNNDQQRFMGLAPICNYLGENQIDEGVKIKGASKARVSQMIKILKSSDSIEESRQLIPPEKGLFNQVKLVSIRNLYNYLQDKAIQPKKKDGRTKEIVLKEAEDLLNSKRGMFSSLQSTSYNRIDQLFCILDSAMKTSTKDSRKNIEVKYFFRKNDFIKIEAVTTTGKDDDIANLSDQRIMRVLNGHYANLVEEKRALDEDFQPDGYFAFDIHMLCEKIGLRPDIKNKDTVRAMLNRLSSTEFKIDATKSEYFKDVFGHDIGRFRYLVESKSVSELETIDEDHSLHQVKERFYQVRIHGDIVKNITHNGKLFISHPKLAREKVGLAHRLSNWCKAVVGVSPERDRLHRYTIDAFYEKVYPAATFVNFKRDLLKLAEREYQGEWKEAEEGSSIKVNFYGYHFTFDWEQALYKELTIKSRRRLKKNNKSEIVITIERDPSDPWVGDDSNHNKTKRLGMIKKQNLSYE